MKTEITSNVTTEEATHASSSEVPKEEAPQKGVKKRQPTANQMEKEIPDYVYTADNMLKDGIIKIPMLLDPIFPKVGIIALTGSSDTGKSVFLRQFAISIVAKQSKFLKYKLNPEYNSVIYVSSEDDEYAISSYLKKQKVKVEDDNDYRKLRFIFNTQKLLEKLDEEMKREPADCVIIDAFGDVCDGEINKINVVRPFLNKYTDFAKEHKCLVIFLHHKGKKTESLAPSKNHVVGSQGFESKMRLVMDLRCDANDAHIRHLCYVKGNYLPSDEKGSSIVLEFDTNMQFKRLDYRVPFDKLSLKNKDDDRKDEIIEKALELKEQGMSYRKIAAELNQSGISVSKSTVAELLKKQSGKSKALSDVQKS